VVVCAQSELELVGKLAQLSEADRCRRASQAMRLLGCVREAARLEPALDPFDPPRRVEPEELCQLVLQ
jgi:hypothetical protein